MSLITSLPQELVMHIASFLNVQDLLSCNYVCENFNTISRDYSLWRRLFVDLKSTNAPVARLCHTSVVHDDRMYVFGGHITQPSSEYFHTVRQDTHAYDFVKREWAVVNEEGARRTEHTTVVDDKKMYVFGGYSGIGYESSVMAYEFANNTWAQMDAKGDFIAARSAHTAVIAGRSMFVFGGWNGTQCMNDLFELNLDTQMWSRVAYTGEAPCTRCSHGATISEDGSTMFIFGGYAIEKAGEANKGYLNDLYEFDIASKNWKRSYSCGEVPSPRSRFRMVSHKDNIYLFAGWNSAVHFNTLFRYSISQKQWVEIPTNFDHEGIGQFSLLVHKDVMYVFSGYSPVSGSRANLFAYPLCDPYTQNYQLQLA